MDNLYSFKQKIWERFRKNKIALAAFCFLIFISLIGIYAPLFASSKPLFVRYEGNFYFPLFRYLFFPGFFTKPIDLFFNVLMLMLPLSFIGALLARRFWNPRGVKTVLYISVALQVILTLVVISGFVKNPEMNKSSQQARLFPDFDAELASLNDYEKLNAVLRYSQQKEQKMRLVHALGKTDETTSLLFELNQRREMEEGQKLRQTMAALEEKYAKAVVDVVSYQKAYLPFAHDLAIKAAALKENDGDHLQLQKNYEIALAEEKKAKQLIEESEETIFKYRYAKARQLYLDKRASFLKNSKVDLQLNPLLRTFHWEEDAGGGQSTNPALPWFERTRLNRKDLASALIFGVRVSLIVGFSSVIISLAIGIPMGLFAGYFAGKVDMIVLRFIEIWEAMPTFFTLLLISAIFHNKSLLLTIIVLGLFSWTGFARFIRAESLRERGLAYVLASKSLGFRDGRIMFSHVLPNAISPILALLPFSMMAAITSEAALSFLGLGEENSTSWGVLMSEARTVFPGESYLLWPPALLLTLFLVAIALVGDGLRDALDPKMQA